MRSPWKDYKMIEYAKEYHLSYHLLKRYTSIHSTLCAPTTSTSSHDEIQTYQPQPHKDSNSELVVVLITMLFIGSAMVGLALKSMSTWSSASSSRQRLRRPRSSSHSGLMVGIGKTYYNPAAV